MTDERIGIYPSGINPAFIHLTGTIISSWARTEGIMIGDIICLRSQPFSAEFVSKKKNEKFPQGGKATIKQWAALLLNAYDKTSDQRDSVETAKTNALAILPHRDRLAHSFWPFGQTDIEKLQLNWIKPNMAEQFGFSTGEYCMTINELNAVNQKFANLYHAVMVISVNSARLYS